MRRKERRHLKENVLAVFLSDLRESLSERRRSIVILCGTLVVGVAGVGTYAAWQDTQRQRAGDLLARALTVLEAEVVPSPDDPVASGSGGMPPDTYPTWEVKFEAALPRLQEVADAYPETVQGLAARYQAAAVLTGLGRDGEAAAEYERVADIAGDQLYGQMGRLGLAEAHLSVGRYTDAIAVLDSQMSVVGSVVPVDAVLMRLGHAYREVGRSDDALAAFTRVTEEFPASVYWLDAQVQADALRQGDG